MPLYGACWKFPITSVLEDGCDPLAVGACIHVTINDSLVVVFTHSEVLAEGHCNAHISA